MRVNLISTHRNQTGLAHDVDILQGIWSSISPEIKFCRVLNAQPECSEAEVNVFFEVLNPSLFAYARKNIYIPNPEWTYRTWIAYLSDMDEIWVKTHEAEKIFKEHHTNVRYIGWTSISKDVAIKNFHKAVYLAGKNIYRHPQIVVDAYKTHPRLADLPELHIVYDGARMKVDVPEDLRAKIKEYSSTLKERQYNEIIQDCGLAICISGAEGFGHAVNEAASTGSVLLLNDITPFQEFHYEALTCKNSQAVNHPECLGVIWKTEIKDLQSALSKYLEFTYCQKKKMSETNVSRYLKNHNDWVERMSFLKEKAYSEYKISDTLPSENDLPTVTIVTPTKDRLKFMEICAGCVESQCYPHDKLEWIIIDDGKDTCEELVKHIPFARHLIEMSGKTIAWKRNRGCELAKHDVIVHMDDDDIYPPNSILFRVSMMLRSKKQVTFCTTLPSYDIANYISFVNVPPMKLPQHMRISEATLCHTKSFWNDGKFPDDVKIAEGSEFLKGRERFAIELSPQEIIVSLVHPRTTSSRRAPRGMESNGCHFGFTDELFKMLSEIAEYLKQQT